MGRVVFRFIFGFWIEGVEGGNIIRPIILGGDDKIPSDQRTVIENSRDNGE